MGAMGSKIQPCTPFRSTDGLSVGAIVGRLWCDIYNEHSHKLSTRTYSYIESWARIKENLRQQWQGDRRDNERN